MMQWYHRDGACLFWLALAAKAQRRVVLIHNLRRSVAGRSLLLANAVRFQVLYTALASKLCGQFDEISTKPAWDVVGLA